jgi:hypothetical protein
LVEDFLLGISMLPDSPFRLSADRLGIRSVYGVEPNEKSCWHMFLNDAIADPHASFEPADVVEVKFGSRDLAARGRSGSVGLRSARVSFAESATLSSVAAGAAAAAAELPLDPAALTAFRSLDADGDGALTAADLTRAAAALGLGVLPEELADAMLMAGGGVAGGALSMGGFARVWVAPPSARST